MKTKGKIALAIIIVIVASIITGLIIYFNLNKKTEIVWYINSPREFGIDMKNIEQYKPLEAERFDLFNKRLEELDIPAKVTFKYQGYDIGKSESFKDSLKNDCKLINEIVKKDKDADISGFSKYEYDKFVTLDDYDSLNKLLEIMPKKMIDVNRINGKLYQVPKANVGPLQPTYLFYKPFLEEYNVQLDEEKIKTMTPREVVDYLLPYFKDKKLLDNKYYLTSMDSMFYASYFVNSKEMLSLNTLYGLWLNLDNKKIENPIETKEYREYLELAQYLYQNNIDAHTYLANNSSSRANPVFQTTRYRVMDELSSPKYKETNDYKEIAVGDGFTLSSSNGNGVLKTSDNKDLAVEVLMASMCDEELSNIIIHGVPNKDYELKDGYAVHKDSAFISVQGSFSSIGNNMIAYPNEMEALDKKEKSLEIIEKCKTIPYDNFTPKYDDKLIDAIAGITNIYSGAKEIGEIEKTQVNDMDKFINEYKQKLKDAGVEELVAELQKQVDNWVE